MKMHKIVTRHSKHFFMLYSVTTIIIDDDLVNIEGIDFTITADVDDEGVDELIADWKEAQIAAQSWRPQS